MAGALRKTMLYLGLADERGDHHGEEYADEYEEPETAVAHDYEAQVTPIRSAASRTPVAPVPAPPVGDLRRITTVHPRSYNDARKIGEAFRDGTPVIMNLSDMDDADAKRLVDFSAGLSFGLHGAIERVTSKVFLLSPAHVEVTAEEQAVPGEVRAGFYNQS
ncbi:cell division protein SepF [Cellulomonas fimi]|uniref:Cell division protein SepF n=1 Tax=Cellulomonas fimi TaxID=1708 RepID=A0A7Y0M1A6_CELFI|nr:cell division protein SepF [Cellulomonas fimi]NMR20602.1 cell division protein SepF [Cellulomonas fimi]